MPATGAADESVRALKKFGAPLDSAGVTVADFSTPGAVQQIGVLPSRIEVLTDITGVTFDEGWRSRDTATLEGFPMALLGCDARVRNRQATGRPKDLADVARLRR